MEPVKNKPGNDILKVIGGILVIAAVGFFLFNSGGDRGLDQSGKVKKNGSDATILTDETDSAPSLKIIVWGGTGECTVVYTNGTYADGTSQYNADGSFAGCLLSNGDLVTPGMYGVDDIITDDGPKGIQNLEYAMVALNFMNGSQVNGVMDQATVDSLKKYQASKGLQQTGKFDAATERSFAGVKVYPTR